MTAPSSVVLVALAVVQPSRPWLSPRLHCCNAHCGLLMRGSTGLDALDLTAPTQAQSESWQHGAGAQRGLGDPLVGWSWSNDEVCCWPALLGP